MTRTGVLVTVAGLLCGCVPQPVDTPLPATPPPAASAPLRMGRHPHPRKAQADPRVAADPRVEQDSMAPPTFVDLDPVDGSLRDLLAVEATKAIRSARRPFVELRAGWCATCRRVDAVLQRPGSPVPRDVVVIRIDTDRWQFDLATAGLETKTIPAFVAVDARGKPAAEPLLGHGWTREGTISRHLTAYFAVRPQDRP